MTPRVAFTVGYEGSSVDELVDTLALAGVTLVVDTRLHPTSRRPDFRRSKLAETLEAAGMRYESKPSLGVPKRIRPLARSRPWMFAMAYRGVLSRARVEVDSTIAATATDCVALLCFEVDPEACHRGLLASAMATEAAILFSHLRARDRKHADDHPVAEDVVRPKNRVDFAFR